MDDEQGKQMEPDALYEWICRFLKSHKTLALAAGVGEDIRCTPLGYVWHGGVIWIFSEGGLKFRALRDSKNVSAAVADLEKQEYVQIQGRADVPDLFSEEYKKAAAARKIPLFVLKKMKEPMWVIKVTPEEFVCKSPEFEQKGFGITQVYQKNMGE